MSVVSSILITKLADFGVKLAISLGWKAGPELLHCVILDLCENRPDYEI